MAWTAAGGGDHEGAAWTVSAPTNVGGTHTNVGAFTVSAAATVTSAFSVACETASFSSTITGNYAVTITADLTIVNTSTIDTSGDAGAAGSNAAVGSTGSTGTTGTAGTNGAPVSGCSNGNNGGNAGNGNGGGTGGTGGAGGAGTVGDAGATIAITAGTSVVYGALSTAGGAGGAGGTATGGPGGTGGNGGTGGTGSAASCLECGGADGGDGGDGGNNANGGTGGTGGTGGAGAAGGAGGNITITAPSIAGTSYTAAGGAGGAGGAAAGGSGGAAGANGPGGSGGAGCGTGSVGSPGNWGQGAASAGSTGSTGTEGATGATGTAGTVTLDQPGTGGDANGRPRIYQRPLALDHTQPLRGAPLQDIAAHLNATAAFGRHHFSRWCARDWNESAPASDDKHLLTKIKPSPDASYLYIALIVEGSGDTADVTFLGTGTANSTTREVPHRRQSGSQEPAPTALQEIVYEYDCTAQRDTLWEIWWTCNRNHVLRCVSVFDSSISLLPTTAHGFVDLTRPAAGKVLTTTTIGELITTQQTIAEGWRAAVCNNATTLDASGYGIAQAAVDSSWRNAKEGTGGTAGWDDEAPGWWYRPSATYGEDPAEQPYVTWRVEAEMSAGGGADAKIKFTHDDGDAYDSDEITVDSDTRAEYTATHELPAVDSFKIQDDMLIQMLIKEGSTGGTLIVHKVSCEETNRSKVRA